MKINHKDIKELYISYLDYRPPISRSECPSPQDITACLRGKRSRKRRNQIIDHVFQCVYCHKEFEFALQTIREEGILIHDLDKIIQENRPSKKKKTYVFLPLRLSWLYSLILITAVVMITLLIKNFSGEHGIYLI